MPFAIVGVNSDPDREALRQVVKQKQLTWQSFWDGSTSGRIHRAWNVTSWPTTYLIDHQGVIRYKKFRGELLDQAIQELLAEMGFDVEVTASQNPIELDQDSGK